MNQSVVCGADSCMNIKYPVKNVVDCPDGSQTVILRPVHCCCPGSFIVLSYCGVSLCVDMDSDLCVCITPLLRSKLYLHCLLLTCTRKRTVIPTYGT